MTNLIDETHAVGRRSWVATANGHREFPIQNLPFGVFSAAGEAPRGGVAIGDEILDLKKAFEAGLFSGAAEQAAAAAAGPTLNAFMQLGKDPRSALRKRLSELLFAGGEDEDAA
jgi:fumarylacetoacetase